METFADGFAVRGPARWRDGAIVTAGDHRIAMAFAVAARAAGVAFRSTIQSAQRCRFPVSPRRWRRRVSAPRRAAVIGHPVAHSRSPALFARFAAASGVALAYERSTCARGARRDARALALVPEFVGCNVTLPHKERALALADRVEPAARACGAANVLTRAGDALVADNTDVAGVEARSRSTASRCAARASRYSARAARRARSPKRRGAAARRASRSPHGTSPARPRSPRISARSRARCDDVPHADLYVNATPVGMEGQPQYSVLPPDAPHDATAFDLVFVPETRRSDRRARARLANGHRHGDVRRTSGSDVRTLWFGFAPTLSEILV